MIPVSPVIPGEDIEETLIAKDQPPYTPLPAIIGDDGTVLTRWKCSIGDRLRILLTGNMYLWIMTFNQPLQPIQVDTKKPTYTTVFKFKDNVKDWLKSKFNLNRKFGWIRTPKGWLCWDFLTHDSLPRVFWTRGDDPMGNADKIIWR